MKMNPCPAGKSPTVYLSLAFFAIFSASIMLFGGNTQKANKAIAINNAKPGIAHTYNKAEINYSRSQKDDYLRTNESSPIEEDQRAKFKGLNYFPPDQKYCVAANLQVYPKPDTLTMLTSKKDRTRTALRYGKFNFSIGGKKLSLIAYLILPAEKRIELFVPFTDLTSGKQTYEAGRYLDIELEPGVYEYILDFNSAYNPYCAYNHKYSCPLVPRENNLKIAIRAGEKKFKK